MDFSEFLKETYFGNTVKDYLILVGLVLLGFIFLRYLSKLLSNFLYRFIEKYSEGISKEKFFEILHRPLAWFVMLVILYTATSHIEFPEEWELAPAEKFGLKMILERLYQLFIIFSVAWILLRIVDFIGLVLLKKAEKTESKQDDQMINFAVEAIKIIILIFTVFVILGSVFNANIGSLVAGLGIGGLALALAAKESLENLLSSFIIFLDKPFVVGDFIMVGNISGTVEKVGFRSTRIRTLEKSFVTLPNRRMVDAELDNISLRTFTRARFIIGILYNTPGEKVKNIVSDIQKIIDENPYTNQDGTVRFFEFGESSLNILVQYFVDTVDWKFYMKVREEINYEIAGIVKKHGSDFAFPTRTVILEKTA